LSEIRATTISDAAGTGPITLTGQSAAKAWASVYYSSGTPTASASFNISSLSDNGTGNYSANFTSSMNSSNYGAGAISIYNTRVATFNSTGASLFNIMIYDISVAPTYLADSSSRFSIHGDLA
jgi:hypothetical protein